jgi:hypothetical protein
MRSLASQILLGGTFLLCASFARAEPPGPGVLPLQVIAIQSDGADDQAEALTAAVRSRVRALRGYSLSEGDFALEVLTLGFKCGDLPDETCQAKIGNHIHADRYVWGAVRRSKAQRQVTADLHLWTRGRPSARTELTFSDNLTTPGDEALKRLVEDALGKLLDSTKPPPPQLAALPAARGAPILPTNANVGARIDAPASTVPDIPEEASSDGRRTTGWAAVGLGGALLAASAYSVVRVHTIDADDSVQLYRQGFHSNVDVCDEARAGVEAKVPGAATSSQMKDFCSAATTFQMLQYVFLGLGAVSAGAGVYLLASDKTVAQPTSSTMNWKMAPSIGRSGGRVDFTFSF